MILKQLKQLTLSATRRNAHLLKLPRLYSSPAVSQPLTTSKVSKRLSRDDRRVVVESFVTKYRAANAGKFPSLAATVKEVGGGYYIVRNILQELKLTPNAPVSRVPASIANDASSHKQDHALESSHPSSDEVSLQRDNNLVITATHEKSETETAPVIKDVDSRFHSYTDLTESQTSMLAAECLRNSETEEEGTLVNFSIQESKADHLEEANILSTQTRYQYNVITATLDIGETKTAPPSNDVDSKCDGSNSQRLKVVEECLKNLETEKEGKLTHVGTLEPNAPVSCVPASAANDASSQNQDHTIESSHLSSDESDLQGDNNLVITATHNKRETETAPPSNDVDSNCDRITHLPENQSSNVAEECLKNSETNDEGTLTQLVSQEPKADHLERANVLLATHVKRESEIVPPNNDVDSKCDGSTLLPDSQRSMLSEQCLNNSETKELTHIGSQEPKADHIEGAAVSANVLPSETRQVQEKGDGEVKTGENSSAWSNIISFAKGFANFWRKG